MKITFLTATLIVCLGYLIGYFSDRKGVSLSFKLLFALVVCLLIFGLTLVKP
jgi:hypothetical protein